MSIDVDFAPNRALRAIGEPLRWRILELLRSEELCVCHLVEMLDAPQSLVSHHLRTLRDAGLVESERFRYWTYYRLRPAGLRAVSRHLEELVEAAVEGRRARRPCC